MDDRLAATIHGHAVARVHVVAGQNEDHLQAREGAHEVAVRFAEPRQALGRGEREVHAGLEHEAVRLDELVQVVALRVADEVGDLALVLGDKDQRRVAGEALPESRE